MGDREKCFCGLGVAVISIHTMGDVVGEFEEGSIELGYLQCLLIGPCCCMVITTVVIFTHL